MMDAACQDGSIARSTLVPKSLAGEGLFFGTGSGRCGTMMLANLLNAEPGVTALHEGKVRHGEDAGDQQLPFLTLQNKHAYHHPDQALGMIEKTRSVMPALRLERRDRLLGDIAYNYAPFVKALAQFFPGAKLIFLHRDGRDFVRSAYTAETPDPTPVGWLDQDRELSTVERYIALGRLRPRDEDDLHDQWDDLHPVEKNAWLWSETNRLILDGLADWPADGFLQVRFEDFRSGIVDEYQRIRAHLGLEGPLQKAVEGLLATKINARRSHLLPPWPDWDSEIRSMFWRHAGPMMERLGYA
jgi:hypothetical protein